jgi:AcrR family transcriptional regulator
VVKEKNTREEILEIALEIVQKQGLKALTQTQVAAIAGLRQSHVTYYFPKKTDLLLAVLDASHEASNKKNHGFSKKKALTPEDEAIELIESLMLNPKKMGFFIGLIAESSDERELRSLLASHAKGFVAHICKLFGRKEGDQVVQDFIDQVRGIGLRNLLENDVKLRKEINIRKIAKNYGLC